MSAWTPRDGDRVKVARRRCGPVPPPPPEPEPERWGVEYPTGARFFHVGPDAERLSRRSYAGHDYAALLRQVGDGPVEVIERRTP